MPVTGHEPGLKLAETVLREADRRRKAAQMQYLTQQFRLDVLDILHEKQTGHWGARRRG